MESTCAPAVGASGVAVANPALVAVVEDEATVRRALARVLCAAHFEVECFASGEEFLASIANRRPDCVVLDMQMTGLSGRDVQRQLAASRLDIPVIIITAHDEPASRAQFMAEGAAAYLCKPLASANLVGAIETALVRSGTQRHP